MEFHDRTILLSIVIISVKRYNYLKKCIKSLLCSIKTRKNNENIEVIVITDESSETLAGYICEIEKEIRIKLCVLKTLNKSSMRNHGVKMTKGELVYFIDDDVVVKENFIEKIIDKFRCYDSVAAVGGPNLTPSGSNDIERAQGYVLSSWWGAAKMNMRYNTGFEDILTDQKGLILCNLGIRKKTLEAEGLIFDTRLNYNEENNLLKMLESKGYQMLFTPEIIVYHNRRKNIVEFSRQVFESGLGRSVSIKINIKNMAIVYFIPSLFLLYIISLPFIIRRSLLSLIPCVIYVMISLVNLFEIYFKREKKIKIMIYSFVIQVIGHISYGLGFLIGLVKPLKNEKAF